MRKKRGQVTIFIIMGIIIVSAIALFLILRTGIVPKIGGGKETNPNTFLEACIEDKVKEAIEIISSQGGYVNPTLYKRFKFEDEDSPIDISYLCYAQIGGVLCVNQEPMLIQHLKNEIKNYLLQDSDYVEGCFNDLISSLERQNYDVVPVYNGFEVELMPKKIIIDIDAELTLTKTGETSKLENFKTIIPSRLYELADMVQRIVNREATSCEFNHYEMFLYPKFDINEFGPTLDSSIIYTVRHEKSNEEFIFAVRGCVISPR